MEERVYRYRPYRLGFWATFLLFTPAALFTGWQWFDGSLGGSLDGHRQFLLGGRALVFALLALIGWRGLRRRLYVRLRSETIETPGHLHRSVAPVLTRFDEIKFAELYGKRREAFLVYQSGAGQVTLNRKWFDSDEDFEAVLQTLHARTGLLTPASAS